MQEKELQGQLKLLHKILELYSTQPNLSKISLPIFHTFVRIRIDGQESIVTEYILSDSYHEFPEEEDQS